MEELKQITELISPLLNSHNLQLYKIGFRKENGMNILQIAIMFEDGSMDIDTCSQISTDISELLDQKDLIKNEYYLEVCSPGAERELKGLKQIIAAINSHVYVSFNEPVDGLNEVTGDLVQANEDLVTISYLKKNIKKSIQIEQKNIKYIRLAVKF